MAEHPRGADVAAVIPVLDHARLLPEAIDSVLEQSEPPGEVVVVDDGSSDGSGDVARAYGDRVRVVRQETLGIGGARNRGVRETTRPVLAFLDADDRWVPDKIRMQLALLTPQVDIVSGWTAQVPEQDWAAVVRDGPPAESWMTGPVPGALLIRRELFERVGPYNPALRAGESLDWYARAVELAARLAILPRVVLLRRVHAESHGTRHPDGYVDYLAVVRAALARRRASEDRS